MRPRLFLELIKDYDLEIHYPQEREMWLQTPLVESRSTLWHAFVPQVRGYQRS